MEDAKSLSTCNIEVIILLPQNYLQGKNSDKNPRDTRRYKSLNKIYRARKNNSGSFQKITFNEVAYMIFGLCLDTWSSYVIIYSLLSYSKL
jgi:hypothetical protein